MPLIEFINIHFGGNKAAFARHMSTQEKIVRPQKVQEWLNAEWIVVDDKLCSVRRDIPPIK